MIGERKSLLSFFCTLSRVIISTLLSKIDSTRSRSEMTIFQSFLVTKDRQSFYLIIHLIIFLLQLFINIIIMITNGHLIAKFVDS